ncbi:hypothetical protein NC653_003150 [Populus alba x Populus x berolinensis]|uniref:Uncharacterized protein n=1 Tax=Populus alba x Populus x berolinensis TaxID=444605 RepID=A0AAD6RRI4_9ROSI|nr:hypothetical protein NC653_003150 [Populus alba x Populus x berolinensis]
MDVDGNTIRHCKPVLLQIRSIIPMLRKDLTHALYVSLPQEQDELIIYDKLHLVQFMYVEKLEAAYLVPMLRGIKPLLGRHPCYGIPKKLLSIDNLKNFLGVSSLETMVEDCIEVPKKTETEKPRSLSVPKVSAYEGTEVSRQRDIALFAAVEALQEASTAERLLKCLSTYSQLLKAKGNDQQLSVDKFFTLQDDLTNTRLILHSLKSIGQRRTADTDRNAPDAVGEALRLALDIKQNTTS